jgi:transposase
MQAPADPLPLADGDREILTRLAASQTASLRPVLRARVLLMAGDGMANPRIAERSGLSVGTVRTWRERYAVDGVAKLGKVAPGRGRKASITQAQIDEIGNLTLHTVPEGETHWSCRTMAKRVGVSPATVQRVWSARGLKPHRVDTFELSNDRRFEEKLIDVVGLYLNPPGRR